MLIHCRKYSTAIVKSGEKLPFAYFLDNKKDFLNSIGKSSPLNNTPHKSEHVHKGVVDVLYQSGMTPESFSRKRNGHIGKDSNADGYEDSFKTSLVVQKREKMYTTPPQPSTTKSRITLKKLMECSLHLGHSPTYWHPKMSPFIYGERAGIHLIDLEKTLVCLRIACSLLTDIASRGARILWVGTSKNIQYLTYECSEESRQFFINKRWIGGTLTNRTQVLKNPNLTPDMIIILNPKDNEIAVEEADKANIPVIAICDTNCDPSKIAYPIPANDDCYAGVELIARTLSLAIKEGNSWRERDNLANRITESATSFLNAII